MGYHDGHYCPRCGYILSYLHQYHCPRCFHEKEIDLIMIPEEYGINFDSSCSFNVPREEYNRRKQFFHDDFLVNQPGFDEGLYWARKEEEDMRLKNKSKKFQADIQATKNKNNPAGVKCRYCGSSNCKKISGLARGLSVGLFGLRSKAIGKQWHCNNCGSDF